MEKFSSILARILSPRCVVNAMFGLAQEVIFANILPTVVTHQRNVSACGAQKNHSAPSLAIRLTWTTAQ